MNGPAADVPGRADPAAAAAAGRVPVASTHASPVAIIPKPPAAATAPEVIICRLLIGFIAHSLRARSVGMPRSAILAARAATAHYLGSHDLVVDTAEARR